MGRSGWSRYADGTLSVLAGTEHHVGRTGTWRTNDRARYCRTLNDGDRNPGEDTLHERCFDAVVKDRAFQFFDADGLMQFATLIE
jgi:hypothetical protein